jgi:secernin
MGSDMAVALPRAAAAGATLFGHNGTRPRGEPQALRRVPGRAFAAGEQLRAQHVTLPQARRTFAVLAVRPAGRWGYLHGVNEHRVAAGVTAVRTRLYTPDPALSGTDLVRLALERAATALQAVDVVTDLVGRHGPGAADPADADGGSSVLVLADPKEAYLVAACGAHWAVQEVRQVRAQSDVCHLRQDWDRISPGLADLAIARGWWPADGSKLDFAGALADHGDEAEAGLRRWGRATMLLEQHNGRVDAPFLRRLLADHGCDPAEGGAAHAPPGHALCRHGPDAATAASLVAELPAAPDRQPLLWWSFGPPCAGVFFPVLLDGELPVEFEEDSPGGGCTLWRRLTRLADAAPRDPHLAAAAREALAGLQIRFNRDAADALGELAATAGPERQRLAGTFMQHAVERFDEAWAELSGEAARTADLPRRAEEPAWEAAGFVG